MGIRLTPELEAFVAANSGPGTHFATADDFVAAVLQEKRERLEAAAYQTLTTIIINDDSDLGIPADGHQARTGQHLLLLKQSLPEYL